MNNMLRHHGIGLYTFIDRIDQDGNLVKINFNLIKRDVTRHEKTTFTL